MRFIASRRFWIVTSLISCFLWLAWLSTKTHSSPLPTPLPRNEFDVELLPPVITLASSLKRLDNELPPTLSSLLYQTLPASEIRLILPLAEEDAIRTRLAMGDLPSQFYHSTVQLIFGEDYGPATKFLQTIESLLDKASVEDVTSLDQPVLVCDDDHVYSEDMLKTLVEAHKRLVGQAKDGMVFKVAVGLRGWRVRRDLNWGVIPEHLSRHVIESHLITADYQVSVLTANEGYLVLPRYFMPDSEVPPLASYPPNDWYSSASPILNYTNAPSSAHLVDDIWMSGTLASLSVPRFVVPLRPPASNSIDITASHPLEGHMAEHKISRAEANNQVLRWFGPAWEKDNIFFEDDPKEELRLFLGPKWAPWFSRARSWVAKERYKIRAGLKSISH